MNEQLEIQAPDTNINPEVITILQENLNKSESPAKLKITKSCKYCNTEYPISMFRIQPNMGDGRKNICIECDNKRTKEYYEKNKEKRLAQVKSWIEKNKDKTKIYQEKTANRRYKNRRIKEQKTENSSVVSPTSNSAEDIVI